jgi:hypothetical protein
MAWMLVRRSGYRWDPLNGDTADRRVPIQAAVSIRRAGYRDGKPEKGTMERRAGITYRIAVEQDALS